MFYGPSTEKKTDFRKNQNWKLKISFLPPLSMNYLLEIKCWDWCEPQKMRNETWPKSSNYNWPIVIEVGIVVKIMQRPYGLVTNIEGKSIKKNIVQPKKNHLKFYFYFVLLIQGPCCVLSVCKTRNEILVLIEKLYTNMVSIP